MNGVKIIVNYILVIAISFVSLTTATAQESGYDVFRAAEKVGSDGFVYGVDMTEAMIDKASSNANKMGINNVSFKIGTAESLPIENNSVDLAISNCVINLTPEKSVVFREIHRVLKPGGRIVIQDVVSLNKLPDSVKNNSNLWNSCIGGAIPKESYVQMIKDAGFHIQSDYSFEELLANEELRNPSSQKKEATKVLMKGLKELRPQAPFPEAEINTKI